MEGETNEAKNLEGQVLQANNFLFFFSVLLLVTHILYNKLN